MASTLLCCIMHAAQSCVLDCSAEAAPLGSACWPPCLQLQPQCVQDVIMKPESFDEELPASGSVTSLSGGQGPGPKPWHCIKGHQCLYTSSC